MKAVTTSLLMICFALVTKAEPVGRQAALYSAQSFMLSKGKIVNGAPVSSRSKAKDMGAEDGQPYYFVFNAEGGGYVIVSGDDRTEPILGYVEQGNFDPENIPENMRSWLQFYTDQIKYVVDNNISPDSPLLKKRNKVHGTKRSIPELLTSRWNQGSPYNITCPKYYKEEDGTQHYPATGCSATAMAQVVYFHRFPEKIKALIPAHSNTYTYTDKADGKKKSVTVTAKAVPRGTIIDWDNMRDTYSWIDIDHANAQDTAVANLMLYCGQGVEMGWNSSSGAVTSKARDFFVKYFGYNESAFWGSRGNYSIDEWFDMLYGEMEQGYPVLYSGHSSGSGHAFVIDGFDGDNLFHVNWGWGGGSNGWFLIGILNPGDNSGIGASTSSDGYSMSQGALFNLRTTSIPKENGFLYVSDVSISGTSVKATFSNRTGSTGNFHTAIVKQDDDGNLSVVGTMQTISSMTNGTAQTKTFAMKGKLPEGTYKLSPASKSSRSETWHAKYNMEGQYIEAVVNQLGEIDLHFKNPTTEDLKIDTITFPGTRIAGEEQEVKVSFRNDGGEYYKTIYFFASKTKTKTYTESKSMVAIRSGETMDASYFFTPETTGTYNLWFCTDEKGNNVVGEGTMEIITEEEAVKADLTVSSYTISNGSNELAYGKCLVGKATIRNNARTNYDGGIRLQIWSQQINSNTAYSGSTHAYNVSIPAGKSVTIDFTFENLNDNYYYRLKAMYSNQDGTLKNGGIWDHRWKSVGGVLTWKHNGTISGQAFRSVLSASTTVCGLYADCDKITRLTPNKNPNTIYAFATGMEIPASLNEHNAVTNGHAKHINLHSGNPYYLPVSFKADSASFTYTFPETEDGTSWHAFTMPFDVDSIFVDSIPVTMDDSLKHFWIYEFAAQSDNGDVMFAPATVLRAETPYIIAADSTMAGQSIIFRALNASFYKTGLGKMVVSSLNYKFCGTTITPSVKDCYILNEEGTAFVYVTTNKTLPAFTSYFITSLPQETRPASIVLPEIPQAPAKIGDLNGDGNIDIADAVTILNLMSKETYVAPADINKDKSIDIADFVSILNMMSKQ